MAPPLLTMWFNIRVNNSTLNRNIGKFNLLHIWDRILLNTPSLTLKRHVQAVGHANSNQPNTPTYLNQPNISIQFSQPNTPCNFSQLLSMLIEPLRTHKAQHFSSPSDLMKSSCWLDESLSSTTNVLFQRIHQMLNDPTEWEIYTKLYQTNMGWKLCIH